MTQPLDTPPNAAPMHAKIALVTGGSKGIGLAIARQFIAAGYQTIICASSQESIDIAKSIEPGLDAILCDVTDPVAIDRMGDYIHASYGALDVLVNNAGLYHPGQTLKESEAALDQMLDANLKSAYRVTRRLAPPMMERKHGAIVNICSTASFTPFANGGSYCIAKYALLGFTKVLREELKPHRVRVIAVMPGATRTASWDGVEVDPERLMPADDVASAVLAACSMAPNTVIEEIVMRPMDGDVV